MEHRASEKYTARMTSSYKKAKQNLSESDSENEAADFPRFIVIESLEDVCLAKLSPFLYRKSIINKGYTDKREENPKRKLACRGGDPGDRQKVY